MLFTTLYSTLNVHDLNSGTQERAQSELIEVYLPSVLVVDRISNPTCTYYISSLLGDWWIYRSQITSQARSHQHWAHVITSYLHLPPTHTCYTVRPPQVVGWPTPLLLHYIPPPIHREITKKTRGTGSIPTRIYQRVYLIAHPGSINPAGRG